jgi:hypothetical protein
MHGVEHDLHLSRRAELGSVPMPLMLADFRRFIADETEKWAKVVKFSGPSGTEPRQAHSRWFWACRKHRGEGAR